MSARMSSADTAWLHMDRPTNLMVINSVLLFDEPVDWERVKQITQRRLVDRYPRFRQRVVESRLPLRAPKWEDDPGLRARAPHAPPRAARARRRRGAAGTGRRPDDDAAGPQPAAVAHVHGRRLRRRRGDDHAGCTTASPTGSRWRRVMLSLTDSEPDAGIEPDLDERSRSRLERAAAEHRRLGTDASWRAPARVASTALPAGRRDRAPPVARETTGGRGRPRRRDRAAPAAHARRRRDRDQGRPGDQPAGRLERRRSRWPRSSESRTPTTRPSTTCCWRRSAARCATTCRISGSPVAEIQAMVPFNLRPLDQPVPRELGNKFGLVFLPLPVGVSGSYRRLVEVHKRMTEIKAVARRRRLLRAAERLRARRPSRSSGGSSTCSRARAPR